ncbi:MAG: hypothetical protein J0M20_04800 [Burkholderiales bacterium]|nr:hypothetical protein [Burkholderiales bacterium]
MPKTGSSSIQMSLFRARDLGNVRYVHAGSANASGALATAFLQDPTQHHANRKRGLSLDDLAQRRQEVLAQLEQGLAAQASRYVISAEVLSNLALDELAQLGDWLRRHVPTVLAVGYVRPPRAFMESAFQQKVKSGIRRMNIGAYYPSYRDRFEKFETVFGRDNVRYWLFDPSAFPGKDVVQDFCQRLDIQLPASSIYRTNEAISRDALALLYAYRCHGPGYGSGPGVLEENARLIREISALRGPKVRFAADAVKAELARYSDDMAWMEERLGCSLAEDMSDDKDVIRGEEDLLNFSSDALSWLVSRLGDESLIPRIDAHPGPEEVAGWVHRLRLEQPPKVARRVARAAQQADASHRPTPSVAPSAPDAPVVRPQAASQRPTPDQEVTVAIESLVHRAGDIPGLQGVSESALVQLAQQVLAQLRSRIEAIDDGALRVPELGRFKIQSTENSAGRGRQRRVALRLPEA